MPKNRFQAWRYRSKMNSSICAVWIVTGVLWAQDQPALRCLSREGIDRKYSTQALLELVKHFGNDEAVVLRLVNGCGVREPWKQSTGEFLAMAGASPAVIARVRGLAPKAETACPESPMKAELAAQVTLLLPGSLLIEQGPVCRFDEMVLEEPKKTNSEFFLLSVEETDADVLALWRGGTKMAFPQLGRLIHLAPRQATETLPLIKDFWIMESEVTHGMWELVKNTPKATATNRNLPKTDVTAAEAAAFCGTSDLGMRLPTSAEWEYAARAGATGAILEKPDTYAWSLENAKSALQPVKGRGKNAFGLFDLMGNASEFTKEREVNEVRGGSVDDAASTLAFGAKAVVPTNWKSPKTGFRCVAEVP